MFPFPHDFISWKANKYAKIKQIYIEKSANLLERKSIPTKTIMFQIFQAYICINIHFRH